MVLVLNPSFFLFIFVVVLCMFFFNLFVCFFHVDLFNWFLLLVANFFFVNWALWFVLVGLDCFSLTFLVYCRRQVSLDSPTRSGLYWPTSVFVSPLGFAGILRSFCLGRHGRGSLVVGRGLGFAGPEGDPFHPTMGTVGVPAEGLALNTTPGTRASTMLWLGFGPEGPAR